MGTTLVFGVLLLAFNLLGDLALLWADPRTREGSEEA